MSKRKILLLIIEFIIFSSIILDINTYFRINSTSIKIRPMDYDDIFGDITLTKPTSLDTLRTGEKFIIEWKANGNIEHVTIALYRKSEFIELIAVATRNSGKYEWNVGEFEDGNDYSIHVWDHEDFNVSDNSDYFRITSLRGGYFDMIYLFILSSCITMVIVIVTWRSFKKRTKMTY